MRRQDDDTHKHEHDERKTTTMTPTTTLGFDAVALPSTPTQLERQRRAAGAGGGRRTVPERRDRNISAAKPFLHKAAEATEARAESPASTHARTRARARRLKALGWSGPMSRGPGKRQRRKGQHGVWPNSVWTVGCGPGPCSLSPEPLLWVRI